METRTLRASALGFGLVIPLCLPLADGAISLEECAQLLGSYPSSGDAVSFDDTIRGTRLTQASAEYQLVESSAKYRLTQGSAEYRLTCDED